jgi:hypothetical protein
MTYTNKERIITIKYFFKNKGLDVPRGIDKMSKNALNAIILEQEIDMEEMLPLAKGTYVKRENKNLIVKSKVETLTQKERDMFNDEIEKVVKRQMNSIDKDPMIMNKVIENKKKDLAKFIVTHKLQDKLNDIIENRPKPKWKQLVVTYNAPTDVFRVPYNWDEKDINYKHGDVYYKGEEVDVKKLQDAGEHETTNVMAIEVTDVMTVEDSDSDDESETSSVTLESEGSRI